MKVAKVGIKKDKGWLYFVDKAGDISRVAMMGMRKKFGTKKQKVAKVGIKKRKDMLYFVDKQGDVSASKLVRGRKKRK